jgi:UDP-N-acetylmuramate dehydrogenase
VKGAWLSGRYINRAFETLEKHLKGNVVRDKILAKETTMRVGGPAGLFAIADSIEQLHIVATTAKEWGLPLFIIGKGSNLLVSDAGFPGIVMRLGSDFMRKRVDGSYLRAGAAISLPLLVQTAVRCSLADLSFAVGIPGSLGGALVMNAGAHGSCMADIVRDVVVYTSAGELIALQKDALKFEYRNGGFSSGDIIVEATMALAAADEDGIKRRMEDNFAARKSSQPLRYPNAGSVFKNPISTSAGKLIEDAGCKGMRIGGAEVSTKHANFIINLENATAFDVYSLLRAVQKRVFDIHGIILEPEIEFLGEFDEALIAVTNDR